MSDKKNKAPLKPANSSKTPAKATKEKTTTDLSVGEILRRARVSEKLSLETVEQNIRIRASMLQAIEDMDLDKLPGWIYTVGFIRSYSDYLNLDSDKMVALLKSQLGDKKKQELNFPAAASESALPDPWIISMAGVGLMALVLIIYIFQFLVLPHRGGDEDINTIPPVPIIEKYAENKGAIENEEPQVNPAPAQEVAQEDIQATIPRDENGIALPAQKPNIDDTAAATSQSYKIIINVIDESWVEISDSNGDVLVSRVLKKGDQYYVPDAVTGLTMTTGNIAGIQMTVNGEDLNVMGKTGEIRRDIPLDPDSLKEMF